MKKFFITGLLLTAISFAFFSCKDDATTEPTVTTKTITINHWGVDWSKGVVGTEGNDAPEADGETINWCPNGAGGGSGIYYRARTEKLYRINTAALSSITTLDTTKWDDDVCDTPLTNGDLWAAKALDGFVVFKVLELPTDPNDFNWKVKVEYKFSTTLTFN
ncbi:MAG: hypothetical protein Q8N03_08330 [Ignavibacteria bacterium]|nr:hypothetical protein [Ignavibacteria bacterium]